MAFGKLGVTFGGLGSNGKGQGVIPGVITARTGSFVITGNDAGLVASHNPLTAGAGSFSITGIDAALTYSGTSFTPTFYILGF